MIYKDGLRLDAAKRETVKIGRVEKALRAKGGSGNYSKWWFEVSYETGEFGSVYEKRLYRVVVEPLSEGAA